MAIHFIAFVVSTDALDLLVLFCQMQLQEVFDVRSVEVESSSSLKEIIEAIDPAAALVTPPPQV